jgi:hypothetical protein
MAILELDAYTTNVSFASGTLQPSAPYVYPPAGSQEVVTVTLFNSSLVAQGTIPFITINATLLYNAVGSWSLVVPYSQSLWNQVMNGDVIIEVNWRNLFTFGGKCEVPGYSDTMPGALSGSGGLNQPGPFMMLSGADYMALLANRICYPAPASAWSAQTAAAADTVTNVPLETAIKHYVNNNIGPGALAARRMNLLDIATDSARGGNTSYTVHFAQNFSLNMMDVIRAMITSAGAARGMGVSVKRNGSRLLMDVYVPRNLTNIAWFSEALGNMTSVNFSLTDPTCTDALVRGSSAFVSSVAASKTQWNAAEQYIDDSSETVASNLNASAQQAVAAGGYGPILSSTPTDSPFLTFGRDYYLGDIVTIEVVPGANYSDVVTSVAISADATQNPTLSVIPSLGNSALSTATDASILSSLSTRIRTLEKKLGI